jgi:hypothetical protein
VATDTNAFVRSAASLDYITQTTAGTYAGQAGPKSWTFNWTAPLVGVGAVRFSCAGNAANNNLSTSGDFIYTTTFTSNGPSNPAPPSLQIQTDKTTYVNGEIVTATEFRISNPGSAPAKAEIKVYLVIPGIEPIPVLNLGSDGSLELPAGINQNLGPLTLFTVTADSARGVWEFSSRLLNPITGELISEDVNTFTVQ